MSFSRIQSCTKGQSVPSECAVSYHGLTAQRTGVERATGVAPERHRDCVRHGIVSVNERHRELAVGQRFNPHVRPFEVSILGGVAEIVSSVRESLMCALVPAQCQQGQHGTQEHM